MILLKLLKNRINKMKNSKIGFVFTKNQYDTSEYFLKNSKIDILLSFYRIDINLKNRNTIFINRFKVFAMALTKTSHLISLLSNRNYKKNLKYYGIRYIKILGVNDFLDLATYYAEEIFNYNDHSAYPALAYDLAKKNNCKTVYVQHAPVSGQFPALYHDLNILFSNDSLEKYKIIEGGKINKKVKIMFDFRFIKGLYYKNHNYPRDSKKILIAPNELDDIDKIKETVNILDKFEVIIRPHQLDKRDFKKLLGPKIKLSNTKNIWKELSSVSIVLTNESALALEAIFMDKHLFKCDFWSDYLDHYGFVKKGLIYSTVKNLYDLKSCIKRMPKTYNYNKLEYFIGKIPTSEK